MLRFVDALERMKIKVSYMIIIGVLLLLLGVHITVVLKYYFVLLLFTILLLFLEEFQVHETNDFHLETKIHLQIIIFSFLRFSILYCTSMV